MLNPRRPSVMNQETKVKMQQGGIGGVLFASMIDGRRVMFVCATPRHLVIANPVHFPFSNLVEDPCPIRMLFVD